jgi:endonuclease-3
MAQVRRARRSRLPIEGVIEALEATYGAHRMIARFDPMEELVSCMLSQHTADANSFPAFTKLRETYATWQDVVNAQPEQLADVIRHAGLANQKAKNIIRALQLIRERAGDYSLEHLRNMSMDEAKHWLMALPGVGPKTASIVLCFSFGMDAIPVDTHVYRVSWRLGLIPEGVGEAKAHDLLLEIVPSGLAYRFHTSFIQHGRTICKAPVPLCACCPVSQCCAWFAKGGPDKRRAELRRKLKKAPKRPAGERG